ncbi:MAG: DUF4270 family protein [Bacteroidales bacterium]
MLTAGILFLANACKEDPSKIGTGLLPASDFVTIKSTDTLTVKSYTMYKDSVESDNPATSYLGEMYDSYFGTTTAGFVSQLRLEDSLTSADINGIDSVKLYMEFLTVTGDTTSQHQLIMSEISRQIYTDSAYYSNQTVPLTGKTWTVTLPTLRADTINSVEVTIPTEFGEYLFRDKSMLFMSSTVPDFRSYFKGLYFQLISTGNPVFTSLSVASSTSSSSYADYFTVYAHDENQVASSYNFLLDAKIQNAAYNLFKHNFSTAEAGKRIQHINDGYEDTLSYLQNLNGVYTRIEIPSLKTLKSDMALKKIAVNKARLVIPFVDDGTDVIYSKTIPSIVYLRYLTSSGKKYFVSDYATAGSAFYDGTPDTVTTFSYNINIATYLQRYLEDATDTITPHLELFLMPTSAHNAVLKANKSYKPVKFEFTYTKF